MKKISLIKSKKYIIHSKKDLVLMVIKSIILYEITEIIVNTQENIEELLMIFVIKDTKLKEIKTN